MDTLYFTPAKPGAKMANKLNRSFHRIGELKRAARDKVQRVPNTSKEQLQKLHPQEDFSVWSLEECDDFLRRQDHSSETASWQDQGLPIEDANGQITVIAGESDPFESCYSVESLPNLPSESVKIVIVAADLKREDMANVVRICKPNGHILRGI